MIRDSRVSVWIRLPGVFSIDIAQHDRKEVAHLFEPPGPVVIDIVAPEVTPGMDAFLFEYVLEIPECADSFVFPGALSDTEDDLFLVVEVDIRVIQRQIWQEPFR